MLPKTDKLELKVVTIIICSSLIICSIYMLYGYGISEQANFPHASWIAIILSIGLWRMVFWVRMLVVVFGFLLLVIVPIGVINPFHAMEMVNPPPVSQLVMQVGIFVIVDVYILHVLIKYKDEYLRII